MMTRLNTSILTIALACWGCAPVQQPETTGRSGSVVAVPGSTQNVASSPKPTTRPVDASGVPDASVVEIITRPVVVGRYTIASTQRGEIPTTNRAGQAPDKAGTTQASVASSANTSSTGNQPPAPDVPAPVLTLDTVKRIDTSLSTAPLVRLLVMKLNGIPYQQFAGYGSLDFTPTLPEGTNPDAMTNDLLSREPAGTATAIGRLTRGEIDIAFVSRPPTETELAAATKANVILRSDRVATEALVFTVNRANPINAMSAPQLRSIFTGKTTIWKDLGGATIDPSADIAGATITVAYRAKGTGSEELLRQILLEGQSLPELPISDALKAARLVLDASNEDPKTIGFSGFAYASNMQRDGRIKILSVDGILPEPTRVATGEYPLTAPIFIIARVDLDPSNPAFKLRAWMLSMPGQKLLAEAGYMPVSSEAWTNARLISGK